MLLNLMFDLNWILYDFWKNLDIRVFDLSMGSVKEVMELNSWLHELLGDTFYVEVC